jgi:hypothetical protein
MEGLIEEGKELMKEKPEEEVLDAGLLAKAQHVEHYEMAGYGTVRTWAQQLGFERQAQLLQETLTEEEETDKLLSNLAESMINLEAEAPSDEASTGARAKRGSKTASKRGRDREVSRGTSMEDGRLSDMGSASLGGRAGAEAR